MFLFGDISSFILNNLRLKLFLTFFLSVLTARLGGWDNLISYLLSFIVIDYIVGVLAAVVMKKVSSSIGFVGIIKKVLILAVVMVASMLDGITLFGDPWIRTAVIYFFIANEGISILENAANAGVPVPSFIIDILQQVQEKGGVEVGK